ncbi:TniB family NTP-binding protein [Paraburkholderia sp. BL18I3N2]|uniref:TniB family NTP-binding protein n=1 Tax=Paraburkholderia sp. BL18I3N2 TaxID=1938799 RepID=UPI000D085308|nr:TniB family NTP-binding protein [Paraburkholderia sp. BL18I3N2]
MDIKSSFIHFPHVKKIQVALDRMREYRCGDEEAEHLMLLGESGVGKSTLLKRYVQKYPRIVHEEFTEIPVLFATLRQSPTPKRLASRLLKVLGDSKWHSGPEDELTERLIFLIEKCRVRLVIVDEANHLTDRGGEKTLHTTADWLKGLADATRVSFVLAGIPRTRSLLAINDQFRGRFREVIEIDRFSVANKSAEREFRSVLKAFKGYLRELPTIDLSEAAIARLFTFATDGRLRAIRSLLVRAVELAYEQPVPRLTGAVLAEAFRTVIYPGSPDTRNPFHKAFNETPLVNGDEPFAPVER